LATFSKSFANDKIVNHANTNLVSMLTYIGKVLSKKMTATVTEGVLTLAPWALQL